MKGSFLWRNRVVLTAGALLVFSLHMISAGVHHGDPLAMPAISLLEALSPLQSATARLGEGTTSVARDYLNLVHVREENLRLRAELARVTADRARLAELQTENHHLADLLELRDALGMDAVAANVIGSDATGCRAHADPRSGLLQRAQNRDGGAVQPGSGRQADRGQPARLARAAD